MNYSYFKGGFKTFSQSRSHFSKSFFNNKYTMNFANSSTNQSFSFKINFGNKFFMTKLQDLNLCTTLKSQISTGRMISGINGTMLSESDSEMGLVNGTPTEVDLLFGDICLVGDSCKWTSSIRLTTGPRSMLMHRSE
jgi:hypothetical protein